MCNYIKPSFKILTTIDGETVLKSIELAGRVCYKSNDKITDRSAKTFVQNIIKRKHLSVLEHGGTISVKFIVDIGVARELTRHRLASFAQESTRYVDLKKHGIELVHPDGLTYSQRERREHHFEEMQALYNEERNEGITPEIARGVLPLSLKTELVMTANLAEWRHVFSVRALGTTGKPHPQMLEVMVPLLDAFKLLIPVVFDDLIIG